MNHNIPHSDDPTIQAKIEKMVKRDKRSDHIFRRVLHVIERTIAVIAIVALLIALALEVWHMFTTGTEYFSDVTHMLHNLLSIVIGLEFVRMLIATTPANVLEVLTLAITRHIVLNHEDP